MDVEVDSLRNKRYDRDFGSVCFDQDKYNVTTRSYSTNQSVRIERVSECGENDLVYRNTFNGASLDVPDRTEDVVEYFFSLAVDDSENWNLDSDELLYFGDREI